MGGKTDVPDNALLFQIQQYALDKPGVLTVVPGIRSAEDVNDLAGFFDRRSGGLFSCLK